MRYSGNVSGRKHVLWYVVGVLVVVVFSLSIIPSMMSSSSDGHAAAANTSSTDLSETARADYDTVRSCPDSSLPHVDLPCLGGENMANTRVPSIQVVNVWAWWCIPCREELPLMVQLREDHPEWSVVGVHEDPMEQSGVEFLDALGVDFPSYQDSSGLFAAEYSLPAVVPVTVVFRSGVLAGRLVKAFTDYSSLETAVSDMVAGTDTQEAG